MKTLKLVEIHWQDAEAVSPGWSDSETPDDLPLLRTFGLLIRKTKNWVYHADTYDPLNDNYAGKSRIPVGMVKIIKVLSTIKY